MIVEEGLKYFVLHYLSLVFLKEGQGFALVGGGLPMRVEVAIGTLRIRLSNKLVMILWCYRIHV
jgi:hypothetical protein